MTRTELISTIKQKGSFLCVGLDTDISRIPKHLLEFDDPIFEFNRAIIDATREHCVAYKPNWAFYEKHGSKGLMSLEKTLKYIGEEHFIIADAKRGDIGNTANMYASAFFDTWKADGLTVNPYMGRDTVQPYSEHKDAWVIALALTSNPGASDYELKQLTNGNYLFEEVLESLVKSVSDEQLMFVVGATQADFMQRVRKHAPTHFLLVPGVGAQGGSLAQVCEHLLISDVGILVNSSRGIIYASSGLDFEKAASAAAAELQRQMRAELKQRNIL